MGVQDVQGACVLWVAWWWGRVGRVGVRGEWVAGGKEAGGAVGVARACVRQLTVVVGSKWECRMCKRCATPTPSPIPHPPPAPLCKGGDGVANPPRLPLGLPAARAMAMWFRRGVGTCGCLLACSAAIICSKIVQAWAAVC